MNRIIQNPRILKYLILVLGCAWLLQVYLRTEVPMDSGDGVMHFFLSQASWSRPELFFHHWGKPLFILLSSPFSQFGFTGLVIFNCLIFFTFIHLSYKILDKWTISEWIQLWIVPVLLLANDTAITILGGLTEPLFNLFLVFALYCFINKKFLLFALVISFTPFLRSEGQLVVILGFLLLILEKQFKALPFLASGFLIYSVMGMMVYQDFWWYFTKSPYSMGNDIYGKGSWSHYFVLYKQYLGRPGLIITITGLIIGIILFFQRKWVELKWKEAFFCYSIFGGILLAHVYFWANGKNGSIGLTRITTQGVPLLLIISLYYFDFGILKKLKISWYFYYLPLGFLIILLLWRSPFPMPTIPLEKQVIEATKFVKTNKNVNEKVFFHFPLFAFLIKENPELKSSYCVFFYGNNLNEEAMSHFNPGDYLVRDSHFGPNEAQLPLSALNKVPELVKVGEFISSEQVEDPTNEIEGLTVYQYIPKSSQQNIQNQKKTISFNRQISIQKDKEFTDIYDLIKPHIKGNSNVTFKLKSLEGDVKFIYDFNNMEEYGIMDLKENQHFSNTFNIRKVGLTKIYFWNPDKKEVKILLEEVDIVEKKFHPIYHQR